jgi:hypothetical protein
MSLEDDIAALNEYYFFREFTYSSTKFRPAPSDEVELADCLIWVGDALVIFQLKERDPPESTTAQEEQRWFEAKVLKKATRQVRDTLGYLADHSNIEVTNHRGHTRSLRGADLKKVQKLVVHLPHAALPFECRRLKHHRSRTGGVIHVMTAHDYLGVVRTLLTPAEVMSYLAFRHDLIDRWEAETEAMPEQALVGRYLQGDPGIPPNLADVERLATLSHRTEDWDVSGLIKIFPERITKQEGPTDYYEVLTAIAELERSELAEFKKRFVLAMEKAKVGDFAVPYRIAIPRTGCGFVFVPMTVDMVPNRSVGLQNLTLAHKYDQRLPRCVGVSVAPDGDGWYSIEWCYIESRWVHDSELEERLRLHNPFRDVKSIPRTRYSSSEGSD